MGTFIDLTGHRYGRLAVVRRAGTQSGHIMWECLCDCGKTVMALGNQLRRKHATVSCGCKRSDTMREIATTHGLSHDPEFPVYNGMMSRCHRLKDAGWEYYGGRGIVVCDRWRFGENGKSGFECFLYDMGPRKSRGLSIDRIDNDGNYEPGNCRWVDRKTQMKNTRQNRYITYNGEMISVQEAANRLGVGHEVIRTRLKRKWSHDRIMETPFMPQYSSKFWVK